MKTRIPFFALFVAGLVGSSLGACSDGAESPAGRADVAPAEQGLALTSHAADLASGTYRAGEYVVAFDAARVADREVLLKLDFAGKHVEVRANFAERVNRVSADDVVLTADDVAAFASLTEALAASPLAATDENAPLVDRAVASAAAYYAEAPANWVVTSHEITPRSKYSTGDDGIVCLSRGAQYNAYYDGFRGVEGELVTAGSDWGTNPVNGGQYGCMGRCGPGCISVFNGLDCLEHDACSYRYNASGGGGDPNCGDEFREAEDDFWWSLCNGV